MFNSFKKSLSTPEGGGRGGNFRKYTPPRYKYVERMEFEKKMVFKQIGLLKVVTAAVEAREPGDEDATLYLIIGNFLLILYSSFTPLILILYSSYTPLILLLYSSYTPLILLLYSSYTSLLLILYSSYTPLLLLLYTSYTPLILL